MRVEDQEQERKPILDMTPEEISRVINEDLEPGTLGLLDKEDQEILNEFAPAAGAGAGAGAGAATAAAPARQAARPAPAPNAAQARQAAPPPAAQAAAGAAKGAPAPVDASRAMATVDALAQHMNRFAEDLREAARSGDARSARLRLGELLGSVNQAKKEVDALCTQLGLPEVAY